jgi:hypothetical protein
MVKAAPSINARMLKRRVDLAAIVGQYTKLRRSGRQLIGLCPLHPERYPSFYIHPGKQVFHCFGCGRGGDIFVFAMCLTGCDFRGALRIVSEFSERVASESEPRSGERFRAGVGAKPLGPAQRGYLNSQSSQDTRSQILKSIDATDRRLCAIAATNRAASAALATACEPRSGEPLFIKNRITAPDGQ